MLIRQWLLVSHSVGIWGKGVPGAYFTRDACVFWSWRKYEGGGGGRSNEAMFQHSEIWSFNYPGF